MNETRRRVLLWSGVGALAGVLGIYSFGRPGRAVETQTFEVMHTDEEWKKILSPNQFKVLREAATERPGSSPLNDEHRHGIFSCAGCDLDLYSSETKFDSGTGWPSFYQPLANAVGTTHDTTAGMVRTAVHCRRCGGHLGHVFNDGPKPTGLRYCMNGLAMKFRAA